MKELLLGVAAIAGLALLAWGGIPVNRYFQTQAEITRTQVMKESQSHVNGMKLQLNNLYLEYQKSDTAGKIGIANVTRDTFASEDTTAYPQHLQDFLRQVKAR
jgi:hypothetical protein